MSIQIIPFISHNYPTLKDREYFCVNSSLLGRANFSMLSNEQKRPALSDCSPLPCCSIFTCPLTLPNDSNIHLGCSLTIIHYALVKCPPE